MSSLHLVPRTLFDFVDNWTSVLPLRLDQTVKCEPFPLVAHAEGFSLEVVLASHFESLFRSSCCSSLLIIADIDRLSH